MKIRALGAEFFTMRTDGRTDGLTDVTKSIAPFRNFAEAPKNRLLGSSYLFFSASVRSSVFRSACLPACLPVCLSVPQNLNSNSAVFT
jgi:hypothetical protein